MRLSADPFHHHLFQDQVYIPMNKGFPLGSSHLQSKKTEHYGGDFEDNVRIYEFFHFPKGNESVRARRIISLLFMHLSCYIYNKSAFYLTL